MITCLSCLILPSLLPFMFSFMDWILGFDSSLWSIHKSEQRNHFYKEKLYFFFFWGHISYKLQILWKKHRKVTSLLNYYISYTIHGVFPLLCEAGNSRQINFPIFIFVNHLGVGNLSCGLFSSWISWVLIWILCTFLFFPFFFFFFGCSKCLASHLTTCWLAQKHNNRRGSQGHSQNKLWIAPDVTPPTPSSATTTTTASPSQGTSASPAGGTGQKVEHWEMFQWVEGAGRTRDHHHHHHQRGLKIKPSTTFPTLSVSSLHCPMTPLNSALHWLGFKNSHVGNNLVLMTTMIFQCWGAPPPLVTF